MNTCLVKMLLFLLKCYYTAQSIVKHHSINYMRLMFFNSVPNKPLFLRVCKTSVFENTVGKGEIPLNKCFLPVCRAFCHFQQI